ncbi:hypothetical protein ACFV7Q_34615 [Streptomyces sp. NPDC059851]
MLILDDLSRLRMDRAADQDIVLVGVAIAVHGPTTTESVARGSTL